MQGRGKNTRSALAQVSAALLVAVSFMGFGSAASDEQICDIRADHLLGREDYPAAIALYRNFLRSHKDSAVARYHLGFAYGMNGRLSDEISEYLQAVNLHLDQWDLFLNLGLAYLDRNQRELAINAMEIAVLLGPEHPQAHFDLALAYEQSDRLPEALQQIVASLRLAPQDPAELNTEAVLLAELGDRPATRDVWTHLLLIAPDYAAAHINLTILHDILMSPQSQYVQARTAVLAAKSQKFTASKNSSGR
jgi:tetratricopeptide (TPR) repeat protein